MKKAYSKKGDKRCTCNFSGKSIAKDHISLVSIGKIDALQAAIDITSLRASGKDKKIIDSIQKKLWQTAGELSSTSKGHITDPIKEKDVENLETFIDSLGKPPEKFIRFNTVASIVLNECRIRCRDLEIHLVKLLKNKKIRPVVYKYINRLSSLFFMLAYRETK